MDAWFHHEEYEGSDKTASMRRLFWVLLGAHVRWYVFITLRFNSVLLYADDIELTVELQWLEHLWDHGNSFEPLRVNHGARSGSK